MPTGMYRPQGHAQGLNVLGMVHHATLFLTKNGLCGWHDDSSPNKTSLVISTLEYEPLWSVCPKVKTDQWILCPKYFLSLDVAFQPIFSLFGDFMTILNFQTLIIIFGHYDPFATLMDFIEEKIVKI
jgi:hypothetical protein